ncbi:tetratricopeptide repeat protein [Persicimonas caeni]|uniref:Tetratricopeptide repeat protein n=1 Tax=Persicimonas caeni TaxID=2292766 RepID=A0A4Y6PYK9_PERCE|nr:tetratricopeptide repeat protein [Persicimonas caeni]QDG53406.1 tetratricopeptide repeat protein [Persicimonas caeni]QED34627.1 tetratricopeptide repeat protein [Persicimonas caeni]
MQINIQLIMQQGWTRSVLAVLFVGLIAAASTGCEPSPKEKLSAAQVAVMNEKPDEAEKYLKEVLEAEPENFTAKRKMGEVEQLRGNYVKAEEQYKSLWDAQGFGKEGAELSTKQESQKALLQENMLKLYEDWAESIDPSESPDKYIEVVKKGLEINPKKTRLNTMLVTAYENQAKKLVEQGKKLEAAAVYEKIPQLYTSSKKRSNAEERATNLRFEANKEQMLGYFNEKAKPELQKEDRYDAENKTIKVSVEKSLDSDMEALAEKAIEKSQGKKVDLKRRSAQHAAIICDIAMRQEVLVPSVEKAIVEATGIPAESDFSKMRVPASVNKGVKIEAGRRDCKLTAALPLDAVLKMGFEVKQQTEKAKAEGEGKEADKAESGAKAEADEAGDKK